MSDNPQLIALTAEEEFRDAGLPYRKTNQLRWLHRHRHANGFAEAFVTVAGRVFLDVPKFHELARSKSSAA